MKLKRYNEINENNSYGDLEGGISYQDYDEIIKFIEHLKEKSKNGVISAEDKILSEVLHMVIKEKDKLDFNSYYRNRLIHIKNKHKYWKRGVETTEFRNLVWWLQNKYEWSFVEPEGSDRVRFEWNDGINVLWLNSDMSIKGFIPEELRDDLIKKGISLDKN